MKHFIYSITFYDVWANIGINSMLSEPLKNPSDTPSNQVSRPFIANTFNYLAVDLETAKNLRVNDEIDVTITFVNSSS